MQSNQEQTSTPANGSGPVPVEAIQASAFAANAILSNETNKFKDKVKNGLDDLVENVVPSTAKINGFFTTLADFGTSVNKKFTDVSSQVKAWVNWLVAQVTEVAAKVPGLINQFCKFISDKFAELVQFVTSLFTGPAPVAAPAAQ